MCEMLWMMCNGEAPEDSGPFKVFDELHKSPFRPRERKQGHLVEVEDGGLLGFAAFKDLQVSLEEDAEGEVPLDIQDLWGVPKRATRDAHIGVVYGVGWRMRMRIRTMRTRTSRVKSPVAPLLTFLTLLPWSLRPLTLPPNWCSCMTWLRQW